MRVPQIVASARIVMSRDGVARTSVRAVASEAGIPLGTMQHVFPTRDLLLDAVIDDVASEARVHAGSVPPHTGVAAALRHGVRGYWHELIVDDVPHQMMQVDLLSYAIRRSRGDFTECWPFSEQVAAIVELLDAAASRADEQTGVPLERIARLLVASMDGLMLQYAADQNSRRAEEDLGSLIDALISFARIRSPHASH